MSVTRFTLVVLTLAAAACAPTPNNEDAGPQPADAGTQPGTFDLASLRGEAARAVCDALYRCCPSADELAVYFAPVANGDPTDEGNKYKDIMLKVPPNAQLSAEDCPAVVEDILELTSLGPWIEAAEAGYVEYRPERAATCVAALDSASCGAEVRQAIFDDTCFSLNAPPGPEQRSVFERKATVGDSCAPIADGFGALYFGSCNPTESFCCILDDRGKCGFPSSGKTGTCEAVAAIGETCSVFDPVLVCATGIECIPGAGPNGSDGCVAPATASLAVGDECYDRNQLRLLGECVGGYCDLFGSYRCEAQKENGAACQYNDECVSGACEGNACGENTLCAE